MLRAGQTVGAYLSAPLHFYRIPICGPGFRAMSAGSIGREETIPQVPNRVSAE